MIKKRYLFFVGGDYTTEHVDESLRKYFDSFGDAVMHFWSLACKKCGNNISSAKVADTHTFEVFYIDL